MKILNPKYDLLNKYKREIVKKSNATRYALHATLFICLAITLLILLRNLNPFIDTIWTGHDITQAARISEFAFNLQNGMLPPRIAPHFSYGLGFPVFNHYAPTAYWIGSLIHLIGFSIPQALKITYALALTIGCTGMIWLIKKTTDNLPVGVASGLLYASSPYIASEIFVRANLAEMWIFALLPLAAAGLMSNHRFAGQINVLILSLLFTAHNALSPVAAIIVGSFILVLPNKLRNIISLLLSFLLSAYFLIPSYVEISLTHAIEVATKTHFANHFLCPMQIWSSQWGFGGSMNGCIDGMSFMLGKVLLICATAGALLYVFRSPLGLTHIRNHQSNADKHILSIIMFITLGSFFLTFQASFPVWKLGLSVFQFPWRFLLIALFGCTYLAGWFFSQLPSHIYRWLPFLIAIYVITINAKYFNGQMISEEQFSSQYLSEEYVHTKAAYNIPEYLPISTHYQYWRSLEGNISQINENKIVISQDGQTFKKTVELKRLQNISNGQYIIPVHWMPYWEIKVNGKEIVPKKFDLLGRPLIDIHKVHSIKIAYKQTPVEIYSNLISISTLITLIMWVIMTIRLSRINKKQHVNSLV